VIKVSVGRCVACGGCVPICPIDALEIRHNELIVSDRCTDCGICAIACPHGALGSEPPPDLPEIRRADKNYGILVIGAGPGGSTAALTAASEGAKVLLLEKKAVVGAPQLCAEGVSRSGLEDIYPNIRPNWVAAPIEGAVLVSPSGARTVVKHPKAGYVLERRVFDRDIFQIAAAAGAHTLVNAPAESPIWERDHIVGVQYTHLGSKRNVYAKVIIAADGVESGVARWLFHENHMTDKEIHVAAQVVMSGIDVELGFPEFHIGRKVAPGGYAWVFPKGDKWANVGLGINPSIKASRGTTAWDFLRKFIDSRFGDLGEIIEVASGNVPTARRLPGIAYRNVLFVGDAGRLTDPISGGGIATALLSGRIAGKLAAEAIQKEDPERVESALGSYSRLWDKAKGKQLAFYSRGKEIFSRLPDPELEGICHFIDEQFGHGSFESIDIPVAIRAILKRKSLVWKMFKALFPESD